MSFKPRLIYFDGEGRAETIRLLLNEAKVDFEDYRFPKNADHETNPTRLNDAFRELKSSGKLAWGSVPAMEIADGVFLAQTGAIYRYVADKYGLKPSDPVEAAWADSVVEACTDVVACLTKTMYGTPESKAQGLTDLKEKHLPKWGTAFEGHLQKAGSGFYGKGFCYADVIAFALWSKINQVSAGAVFAAFTGIKKHCEETAERPNIKAYLASKKK